MIVDIHLRFNGFHGSDGRCHIRFCKESHAMPLVVVCSQYKDYYGTSVTNAFEIIAEKVCYLVANNEVDDIRFDFELPLFDQWDQDVNLFDKLLASLFPSKYRARFLTRKLKIEEVFNHIIWIEHYTEDCFGPDGERRLHRSEFDEDDAPVWSTVSDPWLRRHTGMSGAELLVEGDQLVLHRTDGRVRKATMSSEVTRTRPGLQVVPWTEELVEGLPAMLSAHRVNLKHSTHDDADEAIVQSMIVSIFANRLPSANFFKRNYKFSEKMGIKTVGREKNFDFAIFDPTGTKIDAILELKKTSANSSALAAGVKKDVARLLLLSHLFGCPCYLLVCGDLEIIRQQLQKPDGMLSFDDHPISMDRHFAVKAQRFDREYRGLLEQFGIEQGATRLQGMNTDRHSSALLWQVSADMHTLSSNRPYRYDIYAVS